MLNFIGVVPFSPAIIPEINKKNQLLTKKTIAELEKFSENLARLKPDTIFFVSPRGPMRYDKFTINIEKNLKGNFNKFRIDNHKDYFYSGNYSLAKIILKKLRRQYFPIEAIQEENIDYGTLVPLSFFDKHFKKKPKIVTLTFSSLSWKDHFHLGEILKEVFAKTEENIAFIVNGDLSQRTSNDSPEKFSPYSVKFDQTLIKLLKNSKSNPPKVYIIEFMEIVPSLVKK
jgi:aromatic ring-opening dioxygenase LigB subunit